MIVSYKKLWKLLIDRDLKKKDLSTIDIPLKEKDIWQGKFLED